MKQRYWVKFVLRGTDDYKANTHPPSPEIKGYWCCGNGGLFKDAYSHLICCVIDVDSFGDLHRIIQSNFVDSSAESIASIAVLPKPKDWTPGERFPLASWMGELKKDVQNVSLNGETG